MTTRKQKPTTVGNDNQELVGNTEQPTEPFYPDFLINKVDLIYKESEKAFSYEEQRTRDLSSKAERYIAATSALLGFQLSAAGTPFAFTGTAVDIIASFLAVVSVIFLLATIAVVIFTHKIHSYKSYPRSMALIEQLESNKISDVEAKIKLSKMYLNNYTDNAVINDNRANHLQQSLYLLLIGFLLVMFSNLLFRL